MLATVLRLSLGVKSDWEGRPFASRRVLKVDFWPSKHTIAHPTYQTGDPHASKRIADREETPSEGEAKYDLQDPPSVQQAQVP